MRLQHPFRWDAHVAGCQIPDGADTHTRCVAERLHGLPRQLQAGAPSPADSACCRVHDSLTVNVLQRGIFPTWCMARPSGVRRASIGCRDRLGGRGTEGALFQVRAQCVTRDATEAI